jgi:hypothetical protein
MTELDWRKAGVCDSVSKLRDTILPKDVKQLRFRILTNCGRSLVMPVDCIPAQTYFHPNGKERMDQTDLIPHEDAHR